MATEIFPSLSVDPILSSFDLNSDALSPIFQLRWAKTLDNLVCNSLGTSPCVGISV